MGNIIKREWYIILRNKLFIIGFFLILFFTVAICYIYYDYYYPMDAETDWTEERKDSILELEITLDEEEVDEESKSQIKKDIEVEQYCLTNGISLTSWKANLIKDYLYKTAPDQLMQKAIDQAIDTDN